MKLDDLLQQVFQQYGLLGLVIVFLIFGPGFTYFRTRTMRVEAEAKAQELLNKFIKQERLRADRLEKRLNETLHKLELAEDEVSQVRLRLSQAQSDLDEVSKFKRQVRRLTRRVAELNKFKTSKVRMTNCDWSSPNATALSSTMLNESACSNSSRRYLKESAMPKNSRIPKTYKYGTNGRTNVHLYKNMCANL
ncbi:MAG: hypothetical protein ABI700_02140 [Chloroflexota bacterium]